MINIENISKSYARTQALDNVSLNIAKGEYWGLVGPNGSGKTTLYKCIMGLLTLDDGSIRIDGLDVRSDPVSVKHKVGYSAEPPVLYDYLTGKEYLEFIGTVKNLPHNELDNRIKELLNDFDMVLKADEPIVDYSHGMRKKISLAAALLQSPPILLLDEPTGGLDPESIFKLKKTLLDLRAKGCTMLLSSHIIETVEKLCTHIAVISNGQILLQDSVANITRDLPSGETLESYIISILQKRT